MKSKNLSNFKYHKTNEIDLDLLDTKQIEEYYSKGYKFTRLRKGNMQQTKLIRVDLEKFELSSENRRVLNKFNNLNIVYKELPLINYDWKIGKLAKDFYSIKFGEHTFSANKIKELLTTKFNFNTLLEFSINTDVVGYCICYMTENIIHYSYPFYNLDLDKSSLGIAMMTKTVQDSKENNLKYIYLGGFTTERDKYKLQFKGVEIIN